MDLLLYKLILHLEKKILLNEENIMVKICFSHLFFKFKNF